MRCYVEIEYRAALREASKLAENMLHRQRISRPIYDWTLSGEAISACCGIT